MQCAYFLKNGLQCASMNRRFFWISYIKWYKFYDNDLSVVLGSKHECRWIVLSVNSIADSLGLNFLVYFAEMSSYFSMKTNKRQVRKWLKCEKGFLPRFDLANRKYLSTFTKSRENINRQRNNMMKCKQISFEVTCA